MFKVLRQLSYFSNVTDPLIIFCREKGSWFQNLAMHRESRPNKSNPLRVSQLSDMVLRNDERIFLNTEYYKKESQTCMHINPSPSFQGWEGNYNSLSVRDFFYNSPLCHADLMELWPCAPNFLRNILKSNFLSTVPLCAGVNESFRNSLRVYWPQNMSEINQTFISMILDVILSWNFH